MGQGGNDTATFEDSAGDDTFVGSGVAATLLSEDYIVTTFALDKVTAKSEAGGLDQLFSTDIEFELIQEGDWL